MEYIFNSLWSLMDLVFCSFFWGAFLYSPKTTKQKIVVIAIAWIIGSVYASLIKDQILKQCLTFVLFFIVSKCLYNGPWYQRIIYILLGYIISGIVDILSVYGVSCLLGISYSEFVWRKSFYVVTVTVGKLISILLAWTIQRLRKPSRYRAIQGKWLLLMLLFPAVSSAMLAVVFNGFKEEQGLSLGALAFSGFLMVANIAIIYLIGIMERSTRKIQENALLHQQMEIQTDNIIALEKSYRNQRQATHDYRNQIQTIYDLLTNGNSSEAIEYIQQLQGMQTTRIFTINSHHPIVDAVLNHKYQVARDHKIDFQIQVNDLARVSMETDSLVVLLSNLVDNAIEACCRLPDNKRTIKCSILADDELFISVRNTSQPVSILGDTIPTSKSPKDEHGFGLRRIQFILNQLQAEYTFVYENGWFEFVAEIPIDTK